MNVSRTKLQDNERAQRELLVKTVGIPETTPYSIIIPPNEDMNGFFRKAYHEEYCKKISASIEF